MFFNFIPIAIIFKVQLFSPAFTILLPTYNISLDQSETFDLSDPISQADLSDIYQEEDEMIQKDQLTSFEIHRKGDKFFNLHQWVNRENSYRKLQRSTMGYYKLKTEYYEDHQEPIPWEGGFVNSGGKYIQPENEKVFFLNAMAKKLISQKINEKRANKPDPSPNEETELEYNFNNWEAEYENGIKKEALSSNTLNFTKVEEDESIKDSIKDILGLNKNTTNCTKEEIKGIGLKAVGCLWKDLNKPKLKNERFKILERVLRIILIWFGVYLVVALYFFSTRGWCCCCFTCCCKACRPHEIINEAKAFYANNPLGTYHDDDENLITYEPTNYERYAQKKLDAIIMKL